MALFGFNYNKEGPGVEKNAPPKRSFFRFFEMFKEKFWNLSGLNLLFLLFIIVPVAIAVVLLVLVKKIPVALIPLIPITIPLCAMTLITSKYVREDPVFMWSDFKDAMISNWMQALFAGIFDYAFISIMSVALPFYWKLAQEQVIYYAFFLIMMTLCLLFLFMQFYLYIMIVVFRLETKAVFKNSFIFAIANFWPNMLVAFVTLLITVVCMYMVELIETPLLGGIVIILVCLIIFAALSFFANFTVWPKIKELMQVRDNFDEVNESSFESQDYDEEDEYVFENGKMVKKDK